MTSDGSLLGSGSNDHGEQSMPDGNDFIALAAGIQHNLAVRADGSLVAWGYNSHGQSSFTPAGTDFVDVAGGCQHSLALKQDGSAIAWGHNNEGQCAVPDGVHFLAISAGHSHNLGLVSIGDECANAIPVESNEPYSGATTDATGTGLSSCSYNDTLDVWHTFTPEVTADFTVSLCGSGFDTTLAIFDGCNGEELACNDDTPIGVCSSKLQSRLTLILEKGPRYLIRIAGYDGESGDYALSVTGPTCGEPIPGDMNGDCKFNFPDFAAIVSRWLECKLYPPEACWE